MGFSNNSLVCFIMGLTFTAISFISAGSLANQLFRYKNSEGATVMSKQLPAEYAKYGYEIIDTRGRIIKTVDAELTDEELTEKQQLLAEEQTAQAAQEKQDAYDLSLLRRFSFISDIKAEQGRKVDELNVRVAILKGNLKTVRMEVDTEYEKAAQLERNSNQVSDLVQARIKQLEKQILSTESLLQKHEQDIFELNEEYERAIERFEELLALKAQRHSQNAH